MFDDPWPGDLWAVGLPGGNGAALCTDACQRYTEALTAFRAACEHRRAIRVHELLDRLLRLFGEGYARAKRAVSGLDFEDLELECRELLRTDVELRERYRARFARIMVDELQDTNQVQLELIELLAGSNLFTVGDAQQSIYGFRHADVELFERRGATLSELGARVTLETNFRSRPEILDVINGIFERELAERYRPLLAGRDAAPADEPLVELLVADKGADWAMEGLGAPWRVAEARALAARLERLLMPGFPPTHPQATIAPRDVVLLTRATTDLRVYERALEDRGIPTYVIGGRGYWAHPQVIDMVSYLAALANPRDEESLYTVLVSPLVGVSADALVVLASTARNRRSDAWTLLRDPEGAFDGLGEGSGVGEGDLDLLGRFADRFAIEREVAARAGAETLIERAIDQTGYDLAVLAMPGGQRRLANVRKLMRLAREHEAAHGGDLRGFLDLVARRARSGGAAGGGAGGGESRESEAPVEGEALDAVRLMTIHRAKGLEFDVVCVADLGRGPRWRAELMRIGRDGRFGLRLAEPGTGRRESALDYRALGEERQAVEADEERRLFYVAMTRARERLILSGAAKLEARADLEEAGSHHPPPPPHPPSAEEARSPGSGRRWPTATTWRSRSCNHRISPSRSRRPRRPCRRCRFPSHRHLRRSRSHRLRHRRLRWPRSATRPWPSTSAAAIGFTPSECCGCRRWPVPRAATTTVPPGSVPSIAERSCTRCSNASTSAGRSSPPGRRSRPRRQASGLLSLPAAPTPRRSSSSWTGSRAASFAGGSAARPAYAARRGSGSCWREIWSRPTRRAFSSAACST